MSVYLLLLTFALAPQGTFDFSFCREAPRPEDPAYCIDLNDRGEGLFRITESRQEDVEEPLRLSERALGRFIELIEDTDYLEEGSEYESSSRQLANVGRKTLSIEGEWGTRLASFNYSGRSEVNRILAFLEGLISQQLMLFDLQFAMEFDRLSLPTVLERLEEQLGEDRISDPVAFLDPLERIAGDGRVVNIARTAAERIVEDIQGR